MLKNGTSASPAIALAIRVLPVPGGPTSSTPLGMRPPSRWNRLGSFRKSMISWVSSRASFAPATSLKVTRFLLRCSSFARLLPKLIAPLPAIRICRMNRKYTTANSSRKGTVFTSTARSTPSWRLTE